MQRNFFLRTSPTDVSLSIRGNVRSLSLVTNTDFACDGYRKQGSTFESGGFNFGTSFQLARQDRVPSCQCVELPAATQGRAEARLHRR